MKNKKLERTLDALESIFDVKKGIKKTVKKAKDEVSVLSVQGIIAVKEFSDSIEELFKNDSAETPSDRD